MDVLTQRSRAGVAPTGISLFARRMGDLAAPLFIERRTARAGLGLAAGVVAGLSGGWVAPALGGCVGVLFGWPGLAAFALACFVAAGALRPDLLAGVRARGGGHGSRRFGVPDLPLSAGPRTRPPESAVPSLAARQRIAGRSRRRPARGGGGGERRLLRVLEPGGRDPHRNGAAGAAGAPGRRPVLPPLDGPHSRTSCRPGGRGG